MAYRRWHNHLSDENDGNENENGVDAIVCDYELFMLFNKRGKKVTASQPSHKWMNEWMNGRMKERRTKKVVLKLKYNIWELHGKAIKHICSVVHIEYALLSMAVNTPNITQHRHHLQA